MLLRITRISPKHMANGVTVWCLRMQEMICTQMRYMFQLPQAERSEFRMRCGALQSVAMVCAKLLCPVSCTPCSTLQYVAAGKLLAAPCGSLNANGHFMQATS